MQPIQTVSPSAGRGRERARRGGMSMSGASRSSAAGVRKSAGSWVSSRGSVDHPVADGEGALGGLDQPVMMLRRLAVRTFSRSNMPRISSEASPWLGGGRL